MMPLSAKNLTYARSEVRWVCHSDTSSRRCFFSASPILGASDCFPIHLDGEIAAKASRKRGDPVHENA